MDKILVFSEDELTAGSLGLVLEREHFSPILTNTREMALQNIHMLEPDVLILDVPCAAFAPFEFCMQLQRLRINKPTIVLGDSHEEMDKVLALEAGADDYMVKPFAPREMIARIRALLRRRRSHCEPIVGFGDVEVDRRRLTATCQGREVKMTALEFRLLSFFLGNVDLALPRHMLLTALWGYSDYSNSRTLDTHVCKLRRKFERDPSTPRHFLTIHGVGYRFRL
jgi:DNA-binding response OmpR family regulator